MTFDDFVTLVKSRRSIRYFSDKAVSRADIERLLSVAILAPSVENTQPWHFHVVTNPELKTKLMQTSCYGNFVEGAGAFVVATCNRTAMNAAKQPIWNPREVEYSCTAAMQNMILAAPLLGMGTCWVSLHHGPAHNLLKLKDHMVVVGGLMLGYMKEGEKEMSGQHERKPLTEAVTYCE